jgi:3-hydroxybutyrate dehydrogenase
MKPELSGKVAWVTGSTSGIGLGILRALAQARCDVAMNGFGPATEIASLRAAIAREHGVRVEFAEADMTQPAQIRAAVRDIEAKLGRIDILVNNAGIQHVAAVEDFPEDKWDAVIAVNLSSAFHTMKAALPGMQSRGFGRIINIASAHGLVASAQKSAYVAAKHGLIGLTKVVALENAEANITCNAICPGWVLTPLVQKQIEARAARDGIAEETAKLTLIGEKQPTKRFSTPGQIGELALFLCSEAASNITGAALPIDGAWTAQ